MSVSTLPRMRTSIPLGEPKTLSTSYTDPHACPRCGTTGTSGSDTSAEDKRRIAELEAQVKLLTQKATTAVDKLADYEDQLQQLKSNKAQPPPLVSSNSEPELMTAPQTPPKTSRLSNLLSRRSLNPLASANTSSQSDTDLQAALQREQELRRQAEGKLSQMSTEIEDLSATLFQQANTMVAEERKARAKLEERVEVLEKRDDEKRKRLERLENAMKRIDRVRDLLAP